jgi:hypothetical protein
MVSQTVVAATEGIANKSKGGGTLPLSQQLFKIYTYPRTVLIK